MMRNLIYNNKVMSTILLILVLSILVIGGMKYVNADESIVYDKSFTTLEIQEGDTLTNIAEQYAGTALDCHSYIEEVKYINNLNNDTIHAGCYIVIPIYTPVHLQ